MLIAIEMPLLLTLLLIFSALVILVIQITVIMS